VAFDLLAVGDRDYTGEPFEARRAALEESLRDARPPIHLTPTTRDHDLAREWFAQFEGAGLDGVVAKALDGDLPAGQAGHVQDQAPAHR
jgi:ATP-dependent DNA ligase